MSTTIKLIFAFCFMFSAVNALHHHKSSTRSEKAHTEILSFINARSASLKGYPIAISSLSEKCVATLSTLPTIANDAVANVLQCETKATNDKNGQIDQLKSLLTNLSEDVKTITTSLDGCISIENDLERLKCLNKDAQQDLQMLANVMSTSQNLLEKLNIALQGVDALENRCISDIIESAKKATDAAYTAYEKCLFDTIKNGNGNSQASTLEPSAPPTSSASPPPSLITSSGRPTSTPQAAASSTPKRPDESNEDSDEDSTVIN